MTERKHVRSPWRDAYELLVGSRAGGSESVTLKYNAKGDMQPEVTAVRQDGETLLEAYARASLVLRVAKADFVPSESLLPVEGLTGAPGEDGPFDV